MEILELIGFGMLFIIVLFALLYFAEVLDKLAGDSTFSNGRELNSEQGEGDAAIFNFDEADNINDVIGSYSGILIYRYATIDGVLYEFDHIYSSKGKIVVRAESRCLAPGLVYSPTRVVDTDATTAK